MKQGNWERLLDGVREPVVATGADLRVRVLNAAAERALAVTRAQALGRPVSDLLPGDYGGDAPRAAGPWRWERLDGGWAAYGDNLSPAGAETRREAAAQQLAVDELAAGVAREVASPLTAIGVAVDYLLKGPAGRDAALRGDLETVLAQAQRITRLARRLVELARPPEPVLEPIDFNRVVAEGFELAARQLRRSRVEAALELDPTVAPMRGDAHQLHQVLLNLVLNAQRAVQQPGAAERRVTVATRAGEMANRLVVADTGPGISPDDLPRVFLPFFSRADGTGLGLALARSIVHRHGGTLAAENAPGGGGVFTATFPAGDVDAHG